MATPTANGPELPPEPVATPRLQLCRRYWRLGLKIAVTVFYLFILLVCLPLLILELLREGAKPWFSSWFVGGVFMLLTLPIFIWSLLQHLINYSQPHLQKHIIRILWIVPIYSIDSWLGLKFPATAIYWNTVREVYEAYVLYNFLCYLLNFLEFEHLDLDEQLLAGAPVRQPIPLCCLPPWPGGLRFLRWCKVGVLQYTVIQIITTLLALITELCGVYNEGHFRMDSSYVYLSTLNSISVCVALHSLLYFYKGTKHLLKPIHPVGKFLTIKAIIFFSFWQSVLIALLVKLNALPHSWKEYDVDDVSLGLQNFLICAEMLVAAVVHYFVFSHKPFIDPAASQVPCYSVCLRMLDVRDVCGDVKTHFVDPIPKPSLSSAKKSTTSESGDNERYPLLHPSPAPHPHPSTTSLKATPTARRELTATVEFSHILVPENKTTTVSHGNTDSDHSEPDEESIPQ